VYYCFIIRITIKGKKRKKKMMMSKEQPQFNMSAVFTSHRGPEDQLGGRMVTTTPPVPASLTPEIDTVVDDVMKYVKTAYDESDEEEDDDERDRDRDRSMLNSLTVNEEIANNSVEKSFHETPFGMGDPPSLLPASSQFGRTASMPIFGSSSNPVIDFGLGNHSIIARPTPSRLVPSTEANTVDSDSMSFHFGATSASLTTASNTSSSLNGGGDGITGLGLFSPSLAKMDSKPSYSSLGPGFSLTPPASSNDPSPFSSTVPSSTSTSTATMPFQLGSLSSSSSLSSTSASPASVTPPSANSSPPQMLLFNHQQTQQAQLQQPQLQPPQPQQPKLQPQPVPQQAPHVQSSASHSNQTHFVGTAAVFVPKSMMASSGEAASSAPGGMQYPPHKEFNSYNHSNMYSGVPNDAHGDIPFASQNVGGYNVDSSSPPQPSNGNYRTKGCWYFFQTGHCQKGDRCNFSHDRIPGMEIAPPVPSGNVYIQPMPPYGYGVPPDVPMVGSPRTMTKANPFVVPPAGTPPQTSPPPQVVQPPQQQTSPPNFVAVQQLYRTKPCRFFFEKGTCLKGDRCNFSHDPAYAAAYAANNPNSGFQMPDMSRFTNTTNGSTSSVNGNNVSTTGGSSTVTNTNGPNMNGIRGGPNGNRHQPSTGNGASLLSASAVSRLSSASEVDFPPLG